jgi:hypothetical protein
MIEYSVTCNTENCDNNGIAIQMFGVANMAFVCGPCANEITDVVIVNLETTQE